MTKLLSRNLSAVLAFLFGVVGGFPGPSEAAEKDAITGITIEAARTIQNKPSPSGAGREATSPIDAGTRPPIEPRIATGEREPLAPPPVRRLNVMLDWYLTPYHAPLVVARERDLFAREGLEVTLTTPADPSVPPKLVAAQRAELALTSQLRFHLLVDQGLPLIRVGTLIPAPLATLLVREDGNIDTLSQLKGRTVGYVHERPARILLNGMLKGQSFTMEDVALQRLDFSVSRALAESRVDAVIGAMRHVARHQLAQEGIAATEFMVEENDVPRYDEIILVANRDSLKRYRRDIARFLAALESATLWLINHPQRAWELVRNAEPGLDTEANARAWPDTLRYLALRPAVLQAQRYSNVGTFLQKQGLTDGLPPIERLAVDLSTP